MRDLAPSALFVTFWVGLVPASQLFGPAHVVLAATLRVDPVQGLGDCQMLWGTGRPRHRWLAYGWSEPAYPRHAQPIPTATFITLYAIIHVTAAVVFGRRWFERGDGFEVYSTLLGTLAPAGAPAP